MVAFIIPKRKSKWRESNEIASREQKAASIQPIWLINFRMTSFHLAQNEK